MCTLIDDLDYNASQSRLFQSIFICADRAANHEMTETQIRSVIALLKSLHDGEEIVYDGYFGVICQDVEQFVFQCLTHFLGEGLDSSDPEYTRQAKLACKCCNVTYEPEEVE